MNTTSIVNLFKRNQTKFDGVAPINVYIMRLFFFLMFAFVGFDSWTHIINHQGPWDPFNGVAWCVFAAYSTLSAIGIFHTLKMLPIMLFMIFYKTLWLMVVALPLWMNNELANSEAEGMARVFVWVVVPIIGMPWAYVVKVYLRRRSNPNIEYRISNNE